MERDSELKGRRARKGMGWIAAIVLAIILATFVGYNVYYAVTPG